MADLLVIPVIALALYKIQYKKDGFFEDYLSSENTQMLRGFFAVMVVIYHLGLVADYKKIGLYIHGADAVKIFFFFSGFGLVAQYKRKGQAYLNGFLSKRLIRLIVPCLFLIVPYYMLYKYGLHCYYQAEAISLKAVFKYFFEHGFTFLFNAWYVIEIIVLYLVFYLCFKYFKGNMEKSVFLLTVMTLSLMIGCYVLWQKKDWLNDYHISTHAFAFGAIWALYESQIIVFLKRYFYPIAMLIVFSFTAIYIYIYRVFRRRIWSLK